MNFSDKYIIAITGPSGAGKTTLGDLLAKRDGYAIPYHCTTRNKRSDDRVGFYRYLNHETYAQLLDENKFLISSGDGTVVKKEYGNFYGVLIQDCIDAWKENKTIILFVSYKDLEQLMELKRNGLNINIISVTFSDIEKGVRQRLENDPARDHSIEDINRRVNIAVLDDQMYRKKLEECAKTIVFTDVLNIEETYEKVSQELKK